MKKKLEIVFIAVLIPLTGYIAYRYMTDDAFLTSIRYRFYGLAQTQPDEFSILNYDDTLFIPDWYIPSPEFMKVTWSGDTVERRPAIATSEFILPATSYSGYDSTIIRVEILKHDIYHFVPVSVGASRLIAEMSDRNRDTIHLRVAQKGDKLVIAGNRVVPLHNAPPP